LKLNIIYTEIGRGHPFYLDGIIELMVSNYELDFSSTTVNVFSISRGVSRWFWRLARRTYKMGGRGSLAGRIYKIIRNRKGMVYSGIIGRTMARDIRRHIRKNRYPALVAHPMLVQMISDLVPVYYQHGEAAAPPVSVVPGAAKIFVPLPGTKSEFLESGLAENGLFESGLCIEPKLAEEADIFFSKRVNRLKTKEMLIGAFYSSGAEPQEHIDKIVLMLKSLDRAGQKAIVFCRAGGILQDRMMNSLTAKIFKPDQKEVSLIEALERANILTAVFSHRAGENQSTIKLFKYFDYLVAPSHERSNWALGLGLPMFILHPPIGPFAPLNREILVDRGVAVDIMNGREATDFASFLEAMRRDGRLLKMAESGYGHFDIDGFEKIAEYLHREVLKKNGP
jgi:hypothetical protein